MKSNNEKKLLVVTQAMGYFGETDGAASFYNIMKDELIKRKIKADIITYGPKDKHIKKGSVEIFIHKPKIPLKLDETHYISLNFKGTKLKRMLAKRKYSCVFSGTPESLGELGAYIAKKNNCPLISFYHTELSEYSKIRAMKYFENKKKDFIRKYNKINKTYDKLTIKSANLIKTFMTWWLKKYYDKSNLILVPSKDSKKQVKSFYNGKIKLIPHGVDINRFKPLKNKIENKTPIALYVGKLTPEKNIKIFENIFKNNKNVTLHMVGGGYLKDEIKEKIPSVRLFGRLNGNKLVKQYQNSDFFVFPSKTDTFGLVVLEAMACGIPPIVMNKKGPKEIVKDNITGLIAKDDKDFGKKVELLIKDKELRKKLGKNALKYAKDNSWPKIFDLIFYEIDKIKKES